MQNKPDSNRANKSSVIETNPKFGLISVKTFKGSSD